MKESKFLNGWDEEKVHRVLAQYEKQTEEEALAEDEAAYEDRTQTTIDVPVELVPAVRELIAKHQTSQHPKTTAKNSG
jgi:16S rRNA C1402 N4-methylase RsmH